MDLHFELLEEIEVTIENVRVTLPVMKLVCAPQCIPYVLQTFCIGISASLRWLPNTL